MKKGLALSGGGFRATLYALGTLWRMNEDGLLTELDTVTSVSGGSIAAGLLMLKWNELCFEDIDMTKGRHRAINFKEVIVDPLLAFCSHKITSKSRIVLHTINPLTTAAEEVRKKYEKLLFGSICLSDIPDHPLAPEFIFYGTNLDTGASVRISKQEIRDYNIGSASNHGITLSQAISISSGFPPFLAPIQLCGKDWTWSDTLYSRIPDDEISELRKHLYLCDGGLYDNMGLEMIWKHGIDKEYSSVFCCDAGAALPIPWNSWLKQIKNKFGLSMRMTDIMINQQRALRKRMLMRNYIEGEYDGGYWSLTSQVKDFKSVAPLLSESEAKQYSHLSKLGTQLEPFSDVDSLMLVNLGFCHADMCMRLNYDETINRPSLPFNMHTDKYSKKTSVTTSAKSSMSI
ncbi:patatin-like phospholipase family protein [Vibrio splendidus]|uniref:patatin-like phospholipase family protein n=1 Tax=Vibrio splendidus TaxID=29497 RepID=UPI0013C2F656|nr:patatin-like phospholipase family protein [Vibrio splendidus]